MVKLIVIYWALTTMYGVYWLVKNPSSGDDPDYFSIADCLGYIFPSATLAWFLVPLMLLSSIKIKRQL